MAERVPIWYELKVGAPPATEDLSLPKLAQIAARLKTQIAAAGVAIACAVPANDEIRCVASCGAGAPPVGTVLDVHSGLSGRCIRENRTLFSNNAALDDRVSAGACVSLGVLSFACVPLRQGAKCTGVLAVFSAVAGYFTSGIIERLEREAVRISEIAVPAAPFREKLAVMGSAANRVGRSRTSVNSSRNQARLDDPIRSQVAELAESVRDAQWKRIALIAVSVLVVIVIAAAVAIRIEQRRSPVDRDTAKLSMPKPVRPAASSLSELTTSAQSGNVAAQAQLAQRYIEGKEVEPDKVKACVWFIMAGANGDAQAKASAVALSHSLRTNEIAQIRFNIGKLYVEGTAAPRDLVAAYSWFSLAQAAGDVRAGTEQQKLEAEMTSDQVSEALKRASDWMMAHPSKRRPPSQTVAANSVRNP